MIKGISKIKGGLSVLKQLNYPNEINGQENNVKCSLKTVNYFILNK